MSDRTNSIQLSEFTDNELFDLSAGIRKQFLIRFPLDKVLRLIDIKFGKSLSKMDFRRFYIRNVQLADLGRALTITLRSGESRKTYLHFDLSLSALSKMDEIIAENDAELERIALEAKIKKNQQKEAEKQARLKLYEKLKAEFES